MFTPQEVQDKKFPKAVFGGYDMGEVDEFLDSVSEYYSALYKENVVLKSKLKILAEKVEEYRSVDTAMRKALLGAQKMANEITEEAKIKSDELRTKAQSDYENSRAALKDNIKNEEKRLEKLREETSRFAEASILIYNRQIDMIKRMVSEPAVEKVSAVDKAVEDIERNFSRDLREETQRKPGVPMGSTEHVVNDTESVVAREPQERETMNEATNGSFSSGESDFIAASVTNSASDDGVRADSGYNNYDLSELFSSEAKQSKVIHPKVSKEPGESKEVNVGGMNVRVFEMDIMDDKVDDITL